MKLHTAKDVNIDDLKGKKTFSGFMKYLYTSDVPFKVLFNSLYVWIPITFTIISIGTLYGAIVSGEAGYYILAILMILISYSLWRKSYQYFQAKKMGLDPMKYMIKPTVEEVLKERNIKIKGLTK